MRIPLLSFFTGGGFLDIGFEQAGFKIVWSNEVSDAFADMYEYAVGAWRNASGVRPSHAEISNRKSVTELIAEDIIAEAFHGQTPALFGAIGGPPCPDFSSGGKNGGERGEHGRLTAVFVNLLCKLKPSFFLIENVPGLHRTKKHRAFLYRLVARLERNGYRVDLTILNALELGVPQNRERLFVVGFRNELIKQRLGRRVIKSEREWFPWPEEPRYRKARDLPWPTIRKFDGREISPPKNIPLKLTVYPLLYSDPPPGKLPNGKEHFKPYSEKFNSRQEGDVSSKSFKRLHRFRYSPTAWYGNNEVHLHPIEARRLSVRETLRIQTVPDEYILPPEYPLSAKFKLICNGVPCRMAKRVAESISMFLDPARSARGVYQVAKKLSRKYGDYAHRNKRNPLDELLFIICSLQTDKQKYLSTFRALKHKFPSFVELSEAPQSSISLVLREGGLSNQKADAIKKILRAIINAFGRPTLAPLRFMSDAECEKFLISLPGVGKKTARCVMMYSLDRYVFPVDSNCWRICRRLDWVRRTRTNGSCSAKDMDRLQAKIPPKLRYSLHVNMISLGREICSAKLPKCTECPIKDWCHHVRARL